MKQTMTQHPIDPGVISAHNKSVEKEVLADYRHLGKALGRAKIDIEAVTQKAMAFSLAVPSWGTATGGTRFGAFGGPGEPRNIEEKLLDCGAVRALVPSADRVSLHIPWDKTGDPEGLKKAAKALGLAFDAMNSNTFQDQPGQPVSYKFGSLTHTDAAVRDLAVAHNIECIRTGEALGARALTVWIGDGANFPGQDDFRGALQRYMDSMRKIYSALPEDWNVFIEHKMYEPAFYSTVISDWGTSYWCARELGDKAKCLVDLGHHAPNVNIEQVVARLIQFGKLGGFHSNDSKYGDDDLDAGSIKPFQLFLVFNELAAAELEKVPGFEPSYMLDQSHNVTDPLESLMVSAVEVQRAYVQALLVDRVALAEYQLKNDALSALSILKKAFRTDVSPILALARIRRGGAADPVAVFRESGYREKAAQERA